MKDQLKKRVNELEAELVAVRKLMLALENERPKLKPGAARTYRGEISKRRALWLSVFLAAFLVLGSGLQSEQKSDHALFIDKYGRVGIGTMTPGADLEVAGSTMINGPVGINRAPAVDQHLAIQPLKDHIPLNVTDPSGSQKWLTVTSGGDVIMSGGNVGIGTTDPMSKLEVAGKTQINGAIGINRPPIDNQHLTIQPAEGHIPFNVTDPSGTGNWLTVTAGGNVGIGTASPAAKLEIAGDAIINGKVSRYARYQRDNETEGIYKLSPRYHLSLTGKAYGGRTKTIPHDTLMALCADPDGCQVRLAMTRWSANTQTESASVFFTFYYSQTGDGHWRASATDAGNASGIDGDGTIKHVRNIWDTCYFTDGIYANYKQVDDKTQGMQLLVWNGFKNVDRTCELTLID